MGWFGAEPNRPLAAKLKQAFASWIDNEHTDCSDPHTVLLRLALTDAVLLSHGTR